MIYNDKDITLKEHRDIQIQKSQEQFDAIAKTIKDLEKVELNISAKSLSKIEALQKEKISISKQLEQLKKDYDHIITRLPFKGF